MIENKIIIIADVSYNFVDIKTLLLARVDFSHYKKKREKKKEKKTHTQTEKENKTLYNN